METQILNRCTILVLYDDEGIFDEYVFYLINQLISISSRLIIVINGEIQPEYKERLSLVCKEVIIRKNEDYDVGAYRDVLLNYLNEYELLKFDEVIFCNDTFFGFFPPIKDIFSSMNKSDCDFWGLSYVDRGIFSFVSTYFIVFRSKIINNNEIYKFFKHDFPEDMNSYLKAYVYFEKYLFYKLKTLSYKYDYIEKLNESTYNVFKNSSFYIKHGSPYLKKKVFAHEYYNYDNAMMSLKQIDSKYNYDINLIIDSVKRKYNFQISDADILTYDNDVVELRETDHQCNVTLNDIRKFICSIDKFYVYGDGIIANHLLLILKDDLLKFNGVIVSNNSEENSSRLGYEIYALSDLSPNENFGIIVAMGYENSIEVKEKLKMRTNILFLWKNI